MRDVTKTASKKSVEPQAGAKTPWWVAAVVGLVVVGIAVLVAAEVWGAEHHPILALILYVPYPLYLGPALLAFLLSWRLGWWWRGAATAALVAVLTVVMGLAWGQPDDGQGHVRVMTYNIKAYLAHGDPRLRSELALEVHEHQPDVLMMQDAGQMMTWDASDRWLRQLVGDRDVFHMGQYIIASRLPIKQCGPLEIPTMTRRHQLLRCVLVAHGQEIDLMTVHLITPRHGLNAARQEGFAGLSDWAENVEDRLTQAQLLAQHVRNAKRPVILAGDFNAPENSMVIRTLKDAGLRDAFSVAGFGYGYTHGHSFRTGFSFLRIDHILVSDSIGVVRAETGGKRGSQHRPVIADLLVQRH